MSSNSPSSKSPKIGGLVNNLFEREISGKSLHRLSNPFGKLTPERLSMPMESILPAFALQNGHIFMGFTECGRFVLSYTIREEFENIYNRNEMAFYYKLYIWLFTPYKILKRMASTVLFSNTGVADNNLLIEVSQWRNDDSKLVITGKNCSPEIGGFRSLCYVTMTTLPSTSCRECSHQGIATELEDSSSCEATFIKARCLRHCITTHLVYERVPPYPKFNFEIQLKWRNSIVLNTGNALHIFTYNISGPQKESAFTSELLIPPPHHEPRAHKTRLLRCDFWFKEASNCLQKILSNCSTREAARILTLTKPFRAESNEDCVTTLEAFLSIIPLSFEFRPDPVECQHRRRLSQSSVDSELSCLSSLSRSTNLSSQQSIADSEVQDFDLDKPIASPPKKLNTQLLKVKSTMPPPQKRRKFFKTATPSTMKKSPAINTRRPATSTTHASSSPETFDIFDVGVEEVLLERSLSSYRKRRNADKQYEFSDSDPLTENFLPFKLSRKRQRNQLNFSENSTGSGELPRFEGILTLGPSGYPRSPRALIVHSPAMSPNYSELGDILRPLTNNALLSMSPCHPLLSPSTTREFCEDCTGTDTKAFSPRTHSQLSFTDNCTDSIENENETEWIRPNAKPTFSTNLNCIAKILRCYVDKDDDNLSVKTDTDDEYNQTVPFPVALNLEVHGRRYQSLQIINNSKVKSSPTPVVEILQRTLEVEILCNEVAGMICLSADKNFISCFDYDVVVLDVCPDRGSITALAVVLVQATNLNKSTKSCNEVTHSPQLTISGISDQRQKYEAVFSFVWEPVDENCRILYIGHLHEMDIIPEKWHPTKQILQRLQPQQMGRDGSIHRVLTNELAVYEWRSLDELVDSRGIISLRTSTNSSVSTLSNRGIPSSAFNFSSSSIDTEEEDLSD